MSHVGGGDAERSSGSLAALDAAPLGVASVLSNDFQLGLGDSLCLPTAADADRYVLESGLLSSPDSSTLDDDHLVGDSAPSFFDINDFITDEAGFAASEFMAASDDNSAADHWLGQQVFDFETQVSSENPIQQPQSGASAFGCDDGGIAVGV